MSYIIFFGLAAWFLTGIDDLMIFSHNYSMAKSFKDKVMVILGLVMAVLLMIILVFFLGKGLDFLDKWSFLGFIFPLYLALSTYYSDDTSGNDVEDNIGMFGRGFLGFMLNCSDDIVFNAAVIVGAGLEFQFEYLGGVFLGSLFMILLAIWFSKSVKDMPRIRASILFGVSMYILISGLWNYVDLNWLIG